MTLGSCLQTENSNSLDAETYADDGSDTADFRLVKTILLQNCAGCHDYHTKNEGLLKTSGLFVAASPETSKLYCRLNGSASCSIVGAKNMPSGGALSSSDIQNIRYWIVNAAP